MQKLFLEPLTHAAAGQWWCGGVVGVAGWGAGRYRVPRAGDCFCGPAGCFFGVVAGFAEPLSVTGARGAAVVPRGDVVVVADGGVAVRRAAGIVPDLEEAF